MMTESPRISVVVPVYKVSQYIERCAESLLGQTFEDVEYIFVDDASPDDSRQKLEAVIAKYPGRDVRILTHEKNGGLPSSRRTGVGAARGEYVYNCDSDDWVEPDILECLYSAAKEKNADIVYCDFFLTFETGERYMSNPVYSTPDEMLRKGFLGGAAKWNVWNKLFRRSLYEGIEFPVDHFKGGEDMIVIEMMAKARSISYVPKALYHYVKTNSGAISEGFSPQRLVDVQYNAGHAMAALEEYPSDLTEEIAFFKLNVKLPFIISDSKQKYAVWKDWYPEANPYIMKNKSLPLRTRLVQWCASRNLWLLVRLYYVVVFKFAYRFIR